MIHCIPGDQISHIQIMVAKSGLTNRANVHIPIGVKKSLWFNAQHGRIPIDPAILAAIGHRFIAKKNENLKCWCTGLMRRARIPETEYFFLKPN